MRAFSVLSRFPLWLSLALCLSTGVVKAAVPAAFAMPFFQEKPVEADETDPKKKKKKRKKRDKGAESDEKKETVKTEPEKSPEKAAKDLAAAEAKKRREAARAEGQKRREAAQKRRKEQAQRKKDEARKAKEAAEALAAEREAARQRRKQAWAADKAKLERLEEAEARERSDRREERKRLREAGLEPEPLFASPIVKPKPFVPPPLEERIYEKGEVAMWLPHGDEDDDGVENQYDLCPVTPGVEAFNGCPPGDTRGIPQSARYPELVQFDAYERIYFGNKDDYLDGKARLVLNKAFRLMKDNPEINLRLVGHADRAEGDRTWDYSALRVEAAKNYLRKKGVPADRLDTDIYGGMFPMNRGETEADRRQNRRVELVLFNVEDEAEASPEGE
ncbi:MAG: OmpA family protein [Bacteroidota bacterium]